MTNPHFNTFKKQLSNPFSFKLFAATKLPSAWFAGLRIKSLDEEEASISVQYSWFNTNPFKSIYMAILTMAAEVSTGILCLGAIFRRSPAISMLVVKSEAQYFKKATGTIVFKCTSGQAISNAVDEAIATGQGVTVACTSTGKNAQGEVVAEFIFTWSLKARK